MSDYMKMFAPEEKKPTGIKQTYIKSGCRLSVITDRILRVEIQNSSVFCDSPTQAVTDRSFDDAECTFERSGNILTVQTSAVTYFFDLEKRRMKRIILADGRTVTDFYSGNLRGTKHTLDNTNGFCKLCDGVISTNGVAVLDDSESLIFTSDGHTVKRKCSETDIYFFAYGYDYNDAVRDYFKLTGFPPLIPRFALGNWWSRYKAYTQEEYETLISRFEKEKIPLTVATVDMDWHWVNVEEKFGSDAKKVCDKNNFMEKVYKVIFPGWTGYSWNTDLFPDPKEFLNFLHKKNLHVTMNLHPAGGCRFFENAYKDFCDFLNRNPDGKDVIGFDLSDDKFIEGYFKFLHHPHEKDGVDFWWIDWQQGKKSDVEGLDPLSALNKYHYTDNDSGDKRGLILSRFSGAGAHRYPIGFSGDTFMTWESLAYQPYFTLTASNIGYTWWSHDIGGHTFGFRDDELYLRWIQFGVFSPIMRLHSTSNEFMGKEPWMYRSDVREYATEALRFRHRLIPYIYTANRNTAKYGIPLIKPMYYDYPHQKEAYDVKNQYTFGSEMIVCPITRKIDRKIELAYTECFLPEGRWTDIFTGQIYSGKRYIKLFRDEKSIPVLAKAGAIIPLYPDAYGNSTENPSEYELMIYRGNGKYELYEDDGVSHDYRNGKFCTTDFSVAENGNDVIFEIAPTNGNVTVIPEKRAFVLSFKDIINAADITAVKNGKKTKVNVTSENGHLKITVTGVTPKDSLTVTLTSVETLKNPPLKERRIALFSRIQGFNNLKKLRFEAFVTKNQKTTIPCWLKDALAETDAMD